MDDKYGLYIVSIVAIVAVFAIVAFSINHANTVSIKAGSLVQTDTAAAASSAANQDAANQQTIDTSGMAYKKSKTPATPTILPNPSKPSKPSQFQVPSVQTIMKSLSHAKNPQMLTLKDSAVDYSHNGYIIKFKSQPIIVYQQALMKQATGNSLTTYAIKNIDSQVAAYNNMISTEHANAKASIAQEIGTPIQAKMIRAEYRNTFDGMALAITDQQAAKIKNNPYVAAIYPNYYVHADLMNSVPWIGADKAWNTSGNYSLCIKAGGKGQCLTGKGMKIAIIDTGVDYLHPDLGGCFGSGCKVAAGWDFVNNDSDPMDDMGHGTHVASIAAGKGVLNGVAPDATIYAYKVLDSSGSGSWDTIISGIERATDPNNDGDTSDHVDVISMSLGGSNGNPDDPVSTAVDNSVNAGVIAVIAAGNSGPDPNTIGTPGCARLAITVGASYTGFDDAVYFSSRGPVTWIDASGNKKYLSKPDILAPGYMICAAEWDSAWSDSKCLDNSHVAISGTSMATPHVAGAAALVKQAHPDWTPQEIKSELMYTAVNIFDTPLNVGHGRLDVYDAVNMQKSPSAVIHSITYDRNYIIISFKTANANGSRIDMKKYDTGLSYTDQPWNDMFETLDVGEINYTIDSASFEEGDYYVRASASSKSNNSDTGAAYDISLFNVNNMEIMSMSAFNDYMNANGTAKMHIKIPYSQVRITYIVNGVKKTLCILNSGGQDVSCNYDASSIPDGKYTFTMEYYDGKSWHQDIGYLAVVMHSLYDGWPKQTTYGTTFSLLNDKFTNKNSDDFIITHTTSSDGFWNFGIGLTVYNKSGNYDVVHVSYNGTGHDICLGSEMLSYHESGDTNNLFFRGYCGGTNKLESLRGDGTDSFLQNIVTGGGYDGSTGYTMPDGTAAMFTVYAESVNGRDMFGVEGYNKNGLITRFLGQPVDKQHPAMDAMMYWKPVIIGNNGNIRIGLLGEFYNMSQGMNGPMLYFFDVYTLNGTLVKRVVLKDKINLGDYYFISSYPVGIDTPDTKLFAVPLNLFNQSSGQFEQNTYGGAVYLIDMNGNIISKPVDLKGYTIGGISVTKLQGSLAIISEIQDTWWSFYYGTGSGIGSRISATTLSGTTLFDTALPDIQTISIGTIDGDVNNDGRNEVLAILRPRWFNGSSSSILEFNDAGQIIKNFNLETSGILTEIDHLGITDWNNDGNQDLMLTTFYIPKSQVINSNGFTVLNDVSYMLFVTSFGNKYDMSRYDWPAYLHDNMHSNVYRQSSAPFVNPWCNDSDGGLNFNLQGNMTGVDKSGASYSKVDFCTANVLTEYYCNGTSPNSLSYSCTAYGCSNGACKTSTSTCGDNLCQFGENSVNCPQDCGTATVDAVPVVSAYGQTINFTISSTKIAVSCLYVDGGNCKGTCNAPTQSCVISLPNSAFPNPLSIGNHTYWADVSPKGSGTITTAHKTLTVAAAFCTDTCRTKGFTCGAQSICGQNVNCGSCSTGQTCTNGQCVTSVTPSCNDSDGGINYYLKGVVTGGNGYIGFSLTDYCSANVLTEYYCSGTNPANTTYICTAYGCSNGACSASSHCTDTCSSKGFTCGVQSVCGQNINCGSCSTGQTCTNGQCVVNATNSTALSIGSRIRVVLTTDCVNARTTPTLSSTVLYCHPAGDQGTVVDGPVSADGYTFWNINYDANADGWSAGKYLEKI